MPKAGSSNAWLQRQAADIWVRKAKELGIRSRAFFKLEQMDKKNNLIKNRDVVIDCGAAPGGWSQYSKMRVGPNGTVIAIDVLDIDPPLPGTHFIHRDFTAPETKEFIHTTLSESLSKSREEIQRQKWVSVVLSDMAPNFSGNPLLDRMRTCALAESALHFACDHLKPGGSFVCKILHGPESDALRLRMKSIFNKVLYCKPEASRKNSAEGYFVGLQFRSSRL